MIDLAQMQQHFAKYEKVIENYRNTRVVLSRHSQVGAVQKLDALLENVKIHFFEGASRDTNTPRKNEQHATCTTKRRRGKASKFKTWETAQPGPTPRKAPTGPTRDRSSKDLCKRMCLSCRSRKFLQEKCFVWKIGCDPAEDELREVCLGLVSHDFGSFESFLSLGGADWKHCASILAK